MRESAGLLKFDEKYAEFISLKTNTSSNNRAA